MERKGRKLHKYCITEESELGTLLMEACSTLINCIDAKGMTRTQLNYALTDAIKLIREVESAVKNVNSPMLIECEENE